MDGGQNRQWPDRQHSPLRARILREAESEAQEYRRKPQQQNYRAPGFPGTAAFDSKNGMRELKPAKGKRTAASHSSLPPAHLDDEPVFTTDELLDMSPEDYHATVMQELDRLEQVAASETHPPADVYDILSQDVAGPSSYGETADLDGLLAYNQDSSWPSQPPPGSLHCLPSEPTLPKSPQTRPLTEQQLIEEVKAIYAGLVMVERKCQEIVNQQSESTRRLSDSQWIALIGLHGTFLQEHHDFYFAAQHPSASPALKFLAMKYAIPEYMWRHSMHQFLELLRHRSPSPEQNTIMFGDLCAETMQQLIEHVPQMLDEWDLIKDNLRDYFIALRADGFNVPLRLIDHWYKEETAGAQLRKTLYAPMQGRFFGDDDLPDWFCEVHLPDDFWESVKSSKQPDNGSFGDDSLRGTAQLFLSGWLEYGRKIATSYHVYCQVAIFLAVMALTASLMPWQTP